MNWGLFTALAGFLLPFALAVRLGGELAYCCRDWQHPAWMWRLQLILLLAVPIVASLPGAISLFTAAPTASGAIILEFGETRTGTITLCVKIVAVLVADATKPRIEAQLARTPVTELTPTRVYLLRDLTVILICLSLAWVATWWRAI